MSNGTKPAYVTLLEVPGGTTHVSVEFLKRTEPEPEPELAWHKSPWKSNDIPAEFHNAHFNARQMWSVFGIPDGITPPYGAEVKTQDRHFWTGEPYKSMFRMGDFKAVLGAFAPSALPTWLLIDAEKPGGRTDQSWIVYDYLRAAYPNIQLGCGPIPWIGPLPDDLRRFDFTVTFRNFGSDDTCAYWGRKGADAARWVTRAKAFGIPFTVFPQPVMKYPAADGSTTIRFVRAEDYEEALEICSRSPWGVYMWGVPELLRILYPPASTDMSLPGKEILAAWDAAEHDTTEREMLYIAAQDNWRVETSMCAIAEYAGYEVEYDPALVFASREGWRFYSADGQSIYLDFPPVKIDGKTYQWGDLLMAWYDIGNPARKRYANPFLREQVTKYEQALAVQLREKLGD